MYKFTDLWKLFFKKKNKKLSARLHCFKNERVKIFSAQCDWSPFFQGSDGFGFTIFESIQGQRVKKILYPERCENLLEGDTLLEMRTTYPHGSAKNPVGEERVTNFRGMPHHELVSVLRDCPVGFWARLLVRRSSPKHRFVFVGSFCLPSVNQKWGQFFLIFSAFF